MREKGVEPQEVYAGGSLKPCKNLFIEIISPPQQLFRGGTRSDPNNNSVVLRVTYGEASLLFTGDIEGEAVSGLLASGADISARVLLFPIMEAALIRLFPFWKSLTAGGGCPGRQELFRTSPPAMISTLNDMGG